MKILLVDTLNIIVSRFPTFWIKSFSVMKKDLEQLERSARESGYTPIFVLDLYRAVNQGQQKWRRRQKKLFIKNRSIPCSASCLLGTILSETDIIWTYAVDKEADDWIIDVASNLKGCTILSGDKGYLRVRERNFCVARDAFYNETFHLNHVSHSQNCKCQENVDFPQVTLSQNTIKLNFYYKELICKRTMSKGVFYPSFNILPCCWCFLKDLRKHFYHHLNITSVQESHVCASICNSSGQLTWDVEQVFAKKFDTTNFEETCLKYVMMYESISNNCEHRFHSDHANAVFACAVSCAQLLTDIWFYDVNTMHFLDDLVIGRTFSNFLNRILKKTSTCAVTSPA